MSKPHNRSVELSAAYTETLETNRGDFAVEPVADSLGRVVKGRAHVAFAENRISTFPIRP